MGRDEQLDAVSASHAEERAEFFDGAQFHIHNRGEWEKLHHQRAAPGQTEAVRTAFGRMPDGEDEWKLEFGQRAQKRAGIQRKRVDADLKKIDGLGPQAKGALEGTIGMNGA